MKNLVKIIVLCLLANIGFAQTEASSEQNTTTIEREIRPGDGRQVLQLTPQLGNVEVMIRGGVAVIATYVSPAGQRVNLKKMSETDGFPKPPCKCKLPDACFSDAGFTFIMCQCNPCNLAPKPTVTFAIKGTAQTIVNNTNANH